MYQSMSCQNERFTPILGLLGIERALIMAERKSGIRAKHHFEKIYISSKKVLQSKKSTEPCGDDRSNQTLNDF
jgi:hypothetical protein